MRTKSFFLVLMPALICFMMPVTGSKYILVRIPESLDVETIPAERPTNRMTIKTTKQIDDDTVVTVKVKDKEDDDSVSEPVSAEQSELAKEEATALLLGLEKPNRRRTNKRLESIKVFRSGVSSEVDRDEEDDDEEEAEAEAEEEEEEEEEESDPENEEEENDIENELQEDEKEEEEEENELDELEDEIQDDEEENVEEEEEKDKEKNPDYAFGGDPAEFGLTSKSKSTSSKSSDCEMDGLRYASGASFVCTRDCRYCVCKCKGGHVTRSNCKWLKNEECKDRRNE